ncbi:MAG: hypothetical protein EVJ46_09865 [Candidatus Acididesulfobacter guangdongensis]|uniref:HNH endonuclease n=1 Tax=Acididesulfobacter guangdongensis TaxID=2597225 RepID=A0A519BEX4_ACIG2|nr:MAG: hypothetical protein EVJ46_09865 [Candidatus Acididesulfobacter guangdongensis]
MELNVKVLEKADNLKNNLNIKNLHDNKNNKIKKNLNISEKDIGELSEKITRFENLTDKINAIKSFNDEKLRSSKIMEAESEIKNLCNSGFIIKNNNDFLIKTYGIIDEKTLGSIKNMTYSTSVSENPIVEIQGVKFHEMTKYGRDIAVKNILISQDKFKEINIKKNTGNYSLNNEFKLSDFTLKNYFELKENGLNINIKKTAPGTITIVSKTDSERNITKTAINENNSLFKKEHFNDVKNLNIDNLQLPDIHSHTIINTVTYELLEKPSVYIWKNKSDNIENIISKTIPESSKPLLGALNYYKNYLDGFKNIKISIDNKKIMELESHFNWDKVREYIKKRDYEYAKSIYSQVNISGNQHMNTSLDININKKQTPVQIHHINQLQDGGADNIANYVALSEDNHKQIDSCDVFIDKNLSHYKEYNFEKNIESNNADFKQNITNENEMKNLLSTIGELSTSEKILLNEIKTTVESNSSCRLTMAINNESALKLKFTDYKTDEDLRIYSLKNLSEKEKLIAFAGLNNFIKELTTYNKII